MAPWQCWTFIGVLIFLAINEWAALWLIRQEMEEVKGWVRLIANKR